VTCQHQFVSLRSTLIYLPSKANRIVRVVQLVVCDTNGNQHQVFPNLKFLTRILVDDFFYMAATEVARTMPADLIGQSRIGVNHGSLDFVGQSRGA